MGTINYKTSDYVTIGYNCNNIDYEEYEYSMEIISELYDDLCHVLKDCRFYYYHVTLNGGYYAGFYIDIENNFPYCFDDYREKIDAQREITQIKKFLLECVNHYECFSVSPGWVTSYATRTTTLRDINNAIKEMREEVRKTPTWATLPASEKYS